MKKIVLPIAIKSLHYGLENDNLKGHTATVATAIKQGKSINTALAQVYDIPNKIVFGRDEDTIIELKKNSKADVLIKEVFVFKKIKVNGQEVDTFGACFSFFIKEEIDSAKAQFGRVKLHYPITLKFTHKKNVIDNRRVLNAILNKVNNYAFVTNAFRYDFSDNSLEFLVDIVGSYGTLYSKVFTFGKGVGNRYSSTFLFQPENYEHEIYSVRTLFNDYTIGSDDYPEIYARSMKKAIELATLYLYENGATNISNIADQYPYSLYDISYEIDGVTNYLIVKISFTSKLIFELPTIQLEFLKSFSNVAQICFIGHYGIGNSLKILTETEINLMAKKITKIRIYGD